jgi:hypothetical protein
MIVVVAASTESPDFAVIDFSNAPPTSIVVGATPGGNVVDCYGTLAAVGACANGTVTIFDISNPASPTLRGSVDTGLSGIGAISMDGTNILVGQNNGSQLALIDISNPASPSVKSVYSDGAWLGTISTVAIRGTSAVVGGTDGFGVFDYTNPAMPSAEGYPPTLSSIDLPGQVMADFDGTNAVVASSSAPPDNPFLTPSSYVYGISGTSASGPATVTNGNFPQSVAIAEIPSGGYFVAAGGEGYFWINCFPPGVQGGFYQSNPLAPNMSDTTVAVKFLNNPAVAPFLAVANVTNDGFFVTQYSFLAENDRSTSSIAMFTPNPVAKVALNATLSPTLGITAFTIAPIVRPWGWPFPLPPWLAKLLQRWLGG